MPTLFEVSCEDVDCPLCGCALREPWGDENGWQAVKCTNCPTVYVTPRPKLEAITEAARTGLHPGERLLNHRARFIRSKIRFFRRRFLDIFSTDELEGLNWLDVGCGYGESLAALRQLNVTARGVEPAEHKLTFLRDHGYEAWRSTDQLEGVYDVISSLNVFSHLPDPIAFFADLKPLLVTRGCFVLVTGNIGDLSFANSPRPLYFPDHLVFAGKQSLVELFERRLGMVVEDMREYKEFFRTQSAVERIAKNLVKRAIGRIPSNRHKSGHKYFLMKIRAF